MKKVLYRFLFFAIVFSSFSACKKEEPEDPKIIPAVGKITAEKIVAKPLEVVLLNTESIQFKSTSYQGTFNGQTVQMNTNENKLVFAVPNLPKGNYPFQTTVEGVSFSTTYTIDSVGSINNTDQFIEQHVPLYTLSDTLIDKIVSATTGMGDDASNLTNAQILKKYRDDFKTALAKATPEAKAEFASFVWANPKFFQPFEDVSVQKDSFNIARLGGNPNCPELKLKDIQKGLNSRIADFITLTILYSAVNAATFTIPGVNFIVGAATAGDLMYLVWSMNNWLQIQLDKAIIACTNPDLFSVTRGTYEFSKDEPYTLGVKVAYRNANQTDVGSSSPVLSDIVTNLNKYGNKWNSLMQLVPTAFTGIPFHIKNVTKTKTKQMVVNPDYLAIEIMDNPAVDVSIADADGFVGTFKTTAQTDQNFQFRIYYEFEKINETYQTYQGVLFADKPTGCGGVTSVTDVEGNVYPIVQIGNQCWTKENIRSTKYNDGTNIALVTDEVQWGNNKQNNTTLPMMCWYKNDKATNTANKFGALYNWYAINPTSSSKNVCPAGWHVPTDAEWTTLETFLGGWSVAGAKMKTTGTQYWPYPNMAATNESGFSALPSGFRLEDGTFVDIGQSTYWWSSSNGSEYNIIVAWERNIYSTSNAIIKAGDDKRYGFSVRCLKD